MSIILKGIDLPKEGEEITLAMFHDGDIVSYKYWLPKDAEAIQTPKNHGRLIDAKLLADTINKAIQDGTFTSKSIWEWIGDAPTILEAEE